MDETITVSAVAQIMRRCEDTIRTWADSGKLPSTRTPSGIRIFKKTDVLKFLALREAQGVETRGRRR